MATQSTEAGLPGGRTIAHYEAFAQNPRVRLFAQLNHAGLNTSEAITGSPLVSASSLRTQEGTSRTRFLVETVRKVREAVGDDFPVSVRLSGSDYMKGGSTIADAAQAAQILEREGVDLVDLSGGLNVYMRRGHSEPGWFADMSTAVRRAVRTPVMLTGGVRTPGQARRLLDDGAADLIGVGRATFRNPRWGMEA